MLNCTINIFPSVNIWLCICGFSMARRGLINLPSGEQIFVKIGTEDNSKQWAKKEVAVYRYLAANSYTSIPELISTNADESSFALEALTREDGWDWSDAWTTERLQATVTAMDELSELRPQKEDWMSMGQIALDESRDGWRALSQSPALQRVLLDRLQAAGEPDIGDNLDFDDEVSRSSQFVFRNDTLVHYDVRADNCAWNQSQNQVKFVDWNWTQYGDARIDTAAMLTHVQKAGLDISQSQAERLDASALQWMAGFWLKAAATPIWQGGPAHLRDFQLQSGITALHLVSKA